MVLCDATWKAVFGHGCRGEEALRSMAQSMSVNTFQQDTYALRYGLFSRPQIFLFYLDVD
ncbi:hypothetical protein N879_11480 [Alcaligenes sp. EGD-AK7]|nr:hypothetical protein N879_11480 [Alcaligenes sp. EGD-AK7]